MKYRFIMLFAVLLASLSAFAGPQIGILDPACDADSGFTNIFTNNPGALSITPNANGGGTFTFCNLSGATWSSVLFTAEDFGFPFQIYSPNDPGNIPINPYIACD